MLCIGCSSRTASADAAFSLFEKINQSIHINLSAGAQNITGAYVIIMLVCRRLLTMGLPGKAAV